MKILLVLIKKESVSHEVFERKRTSHDKFDDIFEATFWSFRLLNALFVVVLREVSLRKEKQGKVLSNWISFFLGK